DSHEDFCVPVRESSLPGPERIPPLGLQLSLLLCSQVIRPIKSGGGYSQWRYACLFLPHGFGKPRAITLLLRKIYFCVCLRAKMGDGSRGSGRRNTSERSVILIRCDSGKEMRLCMRGKRLRSRHADLLQCLGKGLDGSETQLRLFGKGSAYHVLNFRSI